MSVFDEPIQVQVCGVGCGIHLRLNQIMPSGRRVEVQIAGPPKRRDFGWALRISDAHVDPRCVSLKRNDEYPDKVTAAVALCDELFRLGYRRLAHGILAEEWGQ